MNNGRSSIFLIVLMIAGGWSVVLSAAPTLAETMDAVPPSTDAIEPPLNTGPNTQQKSGSLLIGSDTLPGKLCLNANAGSGVNDSTNCVSSWSELSGNLPQYLGLKTNLISLGSALYPTAYDSQSGFADVQASGNQVAAAIVRAPAIVGYTATAVHATAGNSSWAGAFNGTVYVKTAGDSSTGEICLGPDASPPYCISNWNDITRAKNYVQRDPSSTQDTFGGGASISGHAGFGSAVLGDPTGINVTYTCGDGVCSSNENDSFCPIDCAAVPSPAQFTAALTAAFPQPNVKLSMTVGSQVTVLIVRSSPNPPVFRPVNGTAYTAGTTIGNDTIIRVDQNISWAYNWTDTSPVSGTTYYYQAYQANAYPRYSTPTAAAAIAPVKLTVGINDPTKASVVGTVGNIACPGSCEALYNRGVTETLTVNSIATGYKVTGWTGCNWANATTCTVTLDGDKSVMLNVAPSDGGGDDDGGGGRVGD